VCEAHVYLQNDTLSYVISVPLLNKGEFGAYYLVLVPLPVDKDKLIYIKATKSLLYVDNVRQYYYMGSEDELHQCNELFKNKCVQAK
jgi:hypothetical protein